MRMIREGRLPVCFLVMAMAFGLHAAWKPYCLVQVASLQVIQPQVNALAAKANFPLLPMVVSAAMAENAVAQAMGQLDARSEWGVQLFANGKDQLPTEVFIWPLPEGRDAWLKAKSGRKLVNGLATVMFPPEPGKPKGSKRFVAFSNDGKTAYVSSVAELAKRCAKEGVKFAKPLVKGLAAVDMINGLPFGEEDFRALEAMLANDGKKADDDDSDGIFQFTPETFPKAEFRRLLETFVKEVGGLRLILGVSNAGLDLRMRLDHRAGSSLARAVRPLSADAVKFDGVPANATLTLASAPLPGAENALSAALRQFIPAFLGAMGAHFDKSIKEADKLIKSVDDKKEAAEFCSTLRAFSFMTAALQALVASPATISGITFSFAEGETNRLRSAFQATGVRGNIAFDRKPPDGVRLENGRGLYSLVAEQRGFNPGKGSFAEAFAQAVPEYAQLKMPLFVGRLLTGFAADEGVKDVSMCAFWTVGWLDQSPKRPTAAYRVLMRLPNQELGRLISSVVKMAEPEK